MKRGREDEEGSRKTSKPEVNIYQIRMTNDRYRQ